MSDFEDFARRGLAAQAAVDGLTDDDRELERVKELARDRGIQVHPPAPPANAAERKAHTDNLAELARRLRRLATFQMEAFEAKGVRVKLRAELYAIADEIDDAIEKL